jgi:ParB/RepB/Spo0J family partition protein
MGILNKYKRIPLEQITIERGFRQRRELDVENLLPSIKMRGVVVPIIVEELGRDQYKLVAGERRCLASKKLGLPDVPARLTTDLSEPERQIIELEENLHRENLPWTDYVLSVAKIHTIYCSMEDGWTQQRTADMIGLASGHSNISIILRVAEEVKKNNPQVLACTGFRPAYNILARKDERAIADVVSELLEERPKLSSGGGSGAVEPQRVAGLAPAPDLSILTMDFLIWLEKWDGPRFNLVHCDFPYGLDMQDSEQGRSAAWGEYQDQEKIYWALCGALCANLDKVMTESAHMIFWFSMEFYNETLEFFAKNAPSLEFQRFPLIWHKTDNKGILPDPRRGPRRVYETAFLVSRGDRPIIRAVSNAYGAPKGSGDHQSEKPEPMLRHFFQMVVDENTRLLDPTCGSGSSLRAAESLGAKNVLGLEVNEEFASAARSALRKFRTLKSMERKHAETA